MHGVNIFYLLIVFDQLTYWAIQEITYYMINWKTVQYNEICFDITVHSRNFCFLSNCLSNVLVIDEHIKHNCPQRVHICHTHIRRDQEGSGKDLPLQFNHLFSNFLYRKILRNVNIFSNVRNISVIRFIELTSS